uniref:Uncharacterized protein n=1 Tax=Panagrolaimus davidi TaxID=227884 RepID=A0A914QU20_9BILA
MKTIFISLLFLVFVCANIDGYSQKKTLKDATANGLFLSYLKRQSKDLRRTIDTFEEIQEKQPLTSPKEKFWFGGKLEGEANLHCCGCPVGSCDCCSSIGIGFCCDFIEDKTADKKSDSNEEE